MDLAEAFRIFGPLRSDGHDAARQMAGDVLLAHLQARARRLGLSREDGEDIVSAILVRWLRRPPGLRHNNLTVPEVKAFLARALRNAVTDRARRLSRRPERPLDEWESLPSTTDGPSRRVALQAVNHALAEAWCAVEHEILSKAVAAASSGVGQRLRTHVADLLAIAEGLETYDGVIDRELQATGESASEHHRVAERVYQRFTRARQRLAPAAFQYMQERTLDALQVGALLGVLEELGVAAHEPRLADFDQGLSQDGEAEAGRLAASEKGVVEGGGGS